MGFDEGKEILYTQTEKKVRNTDGPYPVHSGSVVWKASYGRCGI